MVTSSGPARAAARRRASGGTPPPSAPSAPACARQPTAVAASEPVTITIAPRQLTITTATLANGKIGTAHSQALTAAMGIAPLAWRVSSGHLPPGITLNARTGRLSGAPTQVGTFAFTVNVTDATQPQPMTASTSLSIKVGPSIQAAVYATDGGYSAVQSFPLGSSGNGKPTTSITGNLTGLNATTAAVIDPVSGMLYIASAGTPEIAEYPYGASGNVQPSSVITGAHTGLSYPAALTLDGSGQLYVGDHAANSVTVYPADAAGDQKLLATISGADTGLVAPSGLTFDHTGDLWVANAGANTLTEYASGATGDAQPLATISGSSSGLTGPQGLTLDATGNLLVANLFGGTLTEYTPSDNPDAKPVRTISGVALPDGVDVDATATSTSPTSSRASASTPRRHRRSHSNGNDRCAGHRRLRTKRRSRRATVGDSHKQAARGAHRPPLPNSPASQSRHHALPLDGGPRKLPAGVRLRHAGTLIGRPRKHGIYLFTVRLRDSSHPTMIATRRLVLLVWKNR